MAKTIEDVKGIGPASAALLKEAGIGTLGELAATTIASVTSVKGFSEIRATRVIEGAKALLKTEKKPTAASKKQPVKTKAAKRSSEKKKKADKKKKDKKGGKKKNKKKNAKKKKGNKKGKKKK